MENKDKTLSYGKGVKHLAYGFTSKASSDPTETEHRDAQLFINHTRLFAGVQFEENVEYLYAVSARRWKGQPTDGVYTYAVVVFRSQKLRKSIEKAFAEYSVEPVNRVYALSYIFTRMGHGRKEHIVDGPHVFGMRPTEDKARSRRVEQNAIAMLEDPKKSVIRGDFSWTEITRIKKRRHDFEQDDETKPISKLDNRWYYGPTGAGKSVGARDFGTATGGYYIKNTNKWWDHYEGEPVVIIEDFDHSNADMVRDLKIWADRYPFSGEVKNGHTKFIRPKHVIITSNFSPADIWNRAGDLEPILRRFQVNEVRNFVIGPNANDRFEPSDSKKPTVTYQEEPALDKEEDVLDLEGTSKLGVPSTNEQSQSKAVDTVEHVEGRVVKDNSANQDAKETTL